MTRCKLCRKGILNDLNIGHLLTCEIKNLKICKKCWDEFEKIGYEKCEDCNRRQNKMELCQDCIRWRNSANTQMVNHHALFTYNEKMRNFFYEYKELNRSDLSEIFQSIIKNAMEDFSDYYIIPVQSTDQHLKMRKFDPVVELFSQCELHRNLICKNQKPQASKGREERLRSKNNFEYSAKIPSAKNVLIVDDIYTTGKTFYNAKCAVRMAGYKGYIETFSLVRA